MPEPQPFPYPPGYRWTDSDGNERVTTPWGFNAFAAIEGARAHAAALGRPDSVWYIWRLADGSYDSTAVPDPTTPGHPADLAETVTIHGAGRAKRAGLHIPEVPGA